jgi:hypothetical protein
MAAAANSPGSNSREQGVIGTPADSWEYSASRVINQGLLSENYTELASQIPAEVDKEAALIFAWAQPNRAKMLKTLKLIIEGKKDIPTKYLTLGHETV